ncbi:CpsD/CapB family tyrosine-protein kinase [Bacillus cereus]|uniref:CpsD/CapB family tyrosine-protein kinase n=1 Tax=Bacillus cereus group TaxID=86661 RepID=UPI0008FE536F|nr:MULTISPECIES: CpsD/CapB family tyrosine-protein kinase [Bacillus cereus group]UBR33000.1 CpsD/CapB family tyrosine-protein kinase [Bacillus sp. SD-4]AXO92360.1 tyrosine protein kinase [Bacillus anthracis]MBE3644427.1 CpsD/CapB family tyrosine-protein kinase [Bacillus anthracis]MDA1756407.1 CpsD/CapB family tyrosine-protein kinase [Bacillus cereus]MDA2122704.1 CpsD/CapB family tyrosine-protein kinase [Bacillus cereus]
MSMFKTKKQLLFNPHDALMKEQFYTVYHELKNTGKQVFTVISTKDRGVVAQLIVNIGLVFAEMKKKVLLIDVNFSDPKLHLLLQSNHTKTVNDIISDFTCSYESFSSNLSKYLYCIPAKKTVHTGTTLVSMDEFDRAIAKWREDFDYIFLYSSEVFELPATHISAGKCDGVILAVKKRKDSLRTVQKAITDIKKKECELMGIVLYS